MCSPGDEDLHIHAPCHRVDEPLPDLPVRHEVGVLDPDAAARRLDRHVVEELRHRALVGARRRDRLGLLVPAETWARELLVPVQDLSGRVQPVLHEDALELRHDGAFDAQHHVAPLARVARVSAPAVVDSDAAAEADPAVHGHDFAMRPVAQAVDRVDPERPIGAHLHAGRLAARSRRAPSRDPTASISSRTSTPARARSASACANSEAVRPVVEDVDLDVDARLRARIASSIDGKISAPF